jgi:SsrA-binding protein
VAKKKKSKDLPEGAELIAENRRVRHDFAISETFEGGLELKGTEVKSLRDRHVNFADAYALVRNGEVFLIGLKIEPYSHGTHENHERDRTRKVLLHKKEIDKLTKLTAEKGLTVLPMMLYFKQGWAKVLIGVGRGKSDVDKRQDLKRRDADREVARALRRG